MSYVKGLGVYIHIPFCESKCNYCDFYSIRGDSKLIKEYITSLQKHINEYSASCQNYLIDTIYFGGGTPSIISEKYIREILLQIKKEYNVYKDVEITIEVNPDSVTKHKLKRYLRAGVNRISFGVQSTNNDELVCIGRSHTSEIAMERIALARSVGFNNISVDLMYGLPDQTEDDFLKSVDDILTLKPEHLSCYGLKLEVGTPLYVQNPVLPDDDIQADLYLKLCSKLAYHGYNHYEISNFAMPDKESKHNIKYWFLDEYLGLGPSAHSFLDNKRFSFVRDVNSYIDHINNNENIVDYSDEIGLVQRHGEYIMLALRTNRGISAITMEEKFGVNFTPYEHKLQKYLADGFVKNEMGNWSLTNKGFLVSNTIIGDVIDIEDQVLR